MTALDFDNRLVRNHGCSTSLTQEPAPPVKQIGRYAMAASSRTYRLARFETLLDDCQLLLGCPPPAADITRQQFNVSIRVRHKPVFKPVLEPFCLCRMSGRKWGQFKKGRRPLHFHNTQKDKLRISAARTSPGYPFRCFRYDSGVIFRKRKRPARGGPIN